MKHKGDVEKSLHQITQTSTHLIKIKQQLIKLIDESQREEEKLFLSKKNLEFLIQQQHQHFTSTGVSSASGAGTGAGGHSEGHGKESPTPSSSLLYDRLFSVFEIPISPEQEIEKQVSRVDKLEKEKEKKRKEMEEKKTQLLFALEEKDRVWTAVCLSQQDFCSSRWLPPRL
jgi:hypothetical protein